MTKAELIDLVQEKAGGDFSKKDVAALVDATFDALGDAIRGGRFSYPGFGTFTVRDVAARAGRNPKTNQPIQIPASRTVKFKPSPKFKDSL